MCYYFDIDSDFIMEKKRINPMERRNINFPKIKPISSPKWNIA